MEENNKEISTQTDIVHTVAQLKGRRLRMVRALTGFSRQEIYGRIGIATSTIDTWESGRVELTRKSAERVCEAFRKVGVYCSPDWLLTGTGNPPRMMDEVERSIYSEEKDNQLSQQELKNAGKEHNKFPPFLDELARRELSFFMNLHKGALFHFMKEDFMNARFRKGDCVAGITEKLSELEGKLIIAVLEDGKTVPCRLIKNIDDESTVSFGVHKPTKNIQIKKAAEIVWHRILNKKKN
ncbi:MAG: helix-turn-helix domain-containing protein [Alphaproteobacteria bacterium]|nr:helix-turn-helix domain-containing protein [Alphaproteobacteria bacterium]